MISNRSVPEFAMKSPAWIKMSPSGTPVKSCRVDHCVSGENYESHLTYLMPRFMQAKRHHAKAKLFHLLSIPKREININCEMLLG